MRTVQQYSTNADRTVGQVPGSAAWLATAAWTAMGVVVWAMFPMTATVLLPLCPIAPLGWYCVARGRLPFYPVSLATAVLGLTAVYLLINALWSLDRKSVV